MKLQHVELKNYQQFKNVLSQYEVSERAKRALLKVDLLLVVGPSSVGKNTLISHLIKTGKYYFIVSDTTRPKQFRDGKMEEDGVQYFFRTEEEILKDLNSGEFLEAAIIHEQQVSGISIREIEKAKSMNKIAVADVEIVGAENIMKSNPEVKAVFLVPPSFEEWQRRMHAKTTMTETEILNRINEAKRGIEHALDTNYYRYIIAEDIDATVNIIDQIFHGQPNPQQERAKQVLETLKKDLDEYLAKQK